MDTHVNMGKRCCIADLRDSLAPEQAKKYDSLGPCDSIQRSSRKALKARAKGAKSYERGGVAENKDGEFIYTPSGVTQVHTCANHALFVGNEIVEMEHAVANQRPSGLNPGESGKTDQRIENRNINKTERAVSSLKSETKRRVVRNKERSRTRGIQNSDAPVTTPTPYQTVTTGVTYLSADDEAPKHDIKMPKSKVKGYNSEESTTPVDETPTPKRRERKVQTVPEATPPSNQPSNTPTVNIPGAKVQRMFDVNDLEEDES